MVPSRKRPRSPTVDGKETILARSVARCSSVTPVHEAQKRKPAARGVTKSSKSTPRSSHCPVPASHRDEIVTAIFTITAALGLQSESLHMCIDLLDRYIGLDHVESSELETISITCLWIAVKFMETSSTIEEKRIKDILKRRRHSGNWSWQDILKRERRIVQVLDLRLYCPNLLSTVQLRIAEGERTLSDGQVHLAYYFADLLLLKSQANQYDRELLAEAVCYVASGHHLRDVHEPLLGPVVLIFLAHRDIINPNHPMYTAWFALRCKHGAKLSAHWRVPFDKNCTCRICANAKHEPLRASFHL